MKIRTTEEAANMPAIAKIANGAICEKFEGEQAKVWDNIVNPNTDPEGKRKIVIEIIYKPTEDREEVDVIVNAWSVLCKDKPEKTTFWLSQEAEESEDGIPRVAIKARELNRRQTTLEDYGYQAE